MGSGTSKDAGGPHSLRSRVSSCFALPPTDDELVNGSTKGDGEITSKSTREMDIVILPLSLPQHQYGEGESSRARSRFGFIPERIGLRRLRRTISSRSSRGQTNVTDGVSVVNSEVGERSVRNGGDIGDNQNDLTEENGTEGVVGSDAGANVGPALGNLSASGENRRYNRRLGHQEPSEGSVRFSRTRSVGRLRDRVLRRASSTSSGMFGSGLVEDRLVTASAGYNEEQIGETRVMGGRRRLPLPPRNEIWPDFARSHRYQHVGQLTDGGFDHGSEISNHDLVENRSTFLERRRRIRSQVRALQRLGSRFENLSGHERSCILSGQHRTGRCECRVVTQNGNNPSDDTRTRASISRIVMLAEALFEVLDEIHQHSVALSSRPSFSSIGSVPAPKEVVECMPVKVYTKPQKQPIDEEAAQCYICLVEYDDGDFMRILPCNHEFHQSCIDKWLKEIHRVCPLCRGDVCRSDAVWLRRYKLILIYKLIHFMILLFKSEDQNRTLVTCRHPPASDRIKQSFRSSLMLAESAAPYFLLCLGFDIT